MLDLNFPVAFGAGLVSFFAPCVLPLLPAYIGYVTGVSIGDLEKDGYSPYIKKILLSSLFYILGFSLVFVLLGTAAASFGAELRRYDTVIQRLGGLVIFVLGLQFAGFLKFPLPVFKGGLKLPSWAEGLGHLRAFFVGFIFATVWTPCVGAVLGSILTLAAVTGTAAQGATLLFVYSLGISLPFLITSLTLASAPKYLSVVRRHAGTIAKIAGILLAILGLLLLTDTYKFLNGWLFEVAFKLGYEIR